MEISSSEALPKKVVNWAANEEAVDFQDKLLRY